METPASLGNRLVILIKRRMQKTFSTQPPLSVSRADPEHPILQSLNDTEALLKWSEIETVLSPTYASKTGRPSYPLLTLFRGLLLGIWYQPSDVQVSTEPVSGFMTLRFGANTIYGAGEECDGVWIGSDGRKYP